MMNSRPGMTIASEKAKNHLLWPTMSYTASGLATKRPARRRAGQELLVGDAVHPRLPQARPADDEAEHRPAHGDRGEHRREHADDQHEGEAADHRRAEEEEDRRRDETRD